MPIQIREATRMNADAIAEVHVTTWRAAYRDILPAAYLDSLSVEMRADRWYRSLTAGRPRVLVADVDDTIVGWIAFGPCRDADKDASWGEVEALYVLPAYWGAGVGRRLMESARRKLSDAGYTDALLWVLSENERARAFYGQVGFERDGSGRGIQIARTPLIEVRYSCALIGPWEAASAIVLGL
jgi:GNAT superfamily N-acetyltransferase